MSDPTINTLCIAGCTPPIKIVNILEKREHIYCLTQKSHVLKHLRYDISFWENVEITLSARMVASTPATSLASFKVVGRFHHQSSPRPPQRGHCVRAILKLLPEPPNSIGCILWWKMGYMNAIATTLKMNGVICAHVIKAILYLNE